MDRLTLKPQQGALLTAQQQHQQGAMALLAAAKQSAGAVSVVNSESTISDISNSNDSGASGRERISSEACSNQSFDEVLEGGTNSREESTTSPSARGGDSFSSFPGSKFKTDAHQDMTISYKTGGNPKKSSSSTHNKKKRSASEKPKDSNKKRLPKKRKHHHQASSASGAKNAKGKPDLSTVQGQLQAHPEYSAEKAKAEAKREYNRSNAARARLRNKDMIRDLQQKVAELTKRAEQQEKDNAVLQARLEVITSQNRTLQKLTHTQQQPQQAPAPPPSPRQPQGNEAAAMLQQLLGRALSSPAQPQPQQARPVAPPRPPTAAPQPDFLGQLSSLLATQQQQQHPPANTVMKSLGQLLLQQQQQQPSSTTTNPAPAPPQQQQPPAAPSNSSSNSDAMQKLLQLLQQQGVKN